MIVYHKRALGENVSPSVWAPLLPLPPPAAQQLYNLLYIMFF